MAEPSVKIFEDQRLTSIARAISTVCSTIAAAGVIAIASNMVTLNKAVDKLTFIYEVMRRDVDGVMKDRDATHDEIKEIWRELDKNKIYSTEIQKRLGMR